MAARFGLTTLTARSNMVILEAGLFTVMLKSAPHG
jgi:hypothetical protein